MKRAILTTAAFAAAILLVPAVNAVPDNSWQPVEISQDVWEWTGNWSETSHWSAGHVPLSSETVELPTSGVGSYEVTMNSSVGATRAITIHGDATLTIEETNRLQIGDATDVDSTVNGTIVLEGSSDTNYATLRMMQDRSISGSGSIRGESNYAVIDDDTSTARTLTIDAGFMIHGSLQIKTGTLDNDGLVSADRDNGTGDDTLTCHSGTFRGDYTDPNDGVYRVHGGKMRFSSGVTYTGLDARFIITEGGGTLYIDDNITTTDELEQYGGKIEVAPSKVFQATSS